MAGHRHGRAVRADPELEVAAAAFHPPGESAANLMVQILDHLMEGGLQGVVGSFRVEVRSGYLQQRLHAEGGLCLSLAFESDLGRSDCRQSLEWFELGFHQGLPSGLGIQPTIMKCGFHHGQELVEVRLRKPESLIEINRGLKVFPVLAVTAFSWSETAY